MLALTENARRVLEARYLRRDAERRIIETPEQLLERVARGVAQAELLLGTAREGHAGKPSSTTSWPASISCRTRPR